MSDMIYVKVDDKWHVQDESKTACGIPVPFRAEWSRYEPSEDRDSDCFPEKYKAPDPEFVQLKDADHPKGAKTIKADPAHQQGAEAGDQEQAAPQATDTKDAKPVAAEGK